MSFLLTEIKTYCSFYAALNNEKKMNAFYIQISNIIIP